jgi:hypothetical protein
MTGAVTSSASSASSSETSAAMSGKREYTSHQQSPFLDQKQLPDLHQPTMQSTSYGLSEQGSYSKTLSADGTQKEITGSTISLNKAGMGATGYLTDGVHLNSGGQITANIAQNASDSYQYQRERLSSVAWNASQTDLSKYHSGIKVGENITEATKHIKSDTLNENEKKAYAKGITNTLGKTAEAVVGTNNENKHLIAGSTSSGKSIDYGAGVNFIVKGGAVINDKNELVYTDSDGVTHTYSLNDKFVKDWKQNYQEQLSKELSHNKQFATAREKLHQEVSIDHLKPIKKKIKIANENRMFFGMIW